MRLRGIWPTTWRTPCSPGLGCTRPPRTTLSADTHSVSADTHSAGAGGSLPWDLFTSRVEDHDWSDSEEDAPSAARPPKPYVRRVIASSTGRPTTYYEHRSNGAPATRRPGRQLNNAFDPLFVSPTTTGLVKTSIRPVPIPFAYLRSTDSSDDDFDEERPRKSATPKVRRHLNAGPDGVNVAAYEVSSSRQQPLMHPENDAPQQHSSPSASPALSKSSSTASPLVSSAVGFVRARNKTWESPLTSPRRSPIGTSPRQSPSSTNHPHAEAAAAAWGSHARHT